jgi:hypothetical protein
MRYPDLPQESHHESISRMTKEEKITSDGKATEYYDFPEDSETLNDLIEHKNMSFAQGNIFKAAYRLGNKNGIDELYDLNKIIYYAERMINRLAKQQNLNIKSE